MKNLLKLATLASFCFAMIVFGACGGGGGGGQGGYTVTVNGTAYTASGGWTVMDGVTYVRTGTDTAWTVAEGAYTVRDGITYVRTGTDTAWHTINH